MSKKLCVVLRAFSVNCGSSAFSLKTSSNTIRSIEVSFFISFTLRFTCIRIKCLYKSTLNLHRPPMSWLLSKQVGSRPSSKQDLMLVRPEIPAPITATFWTMLERKCDWQQRGLRSDIPAGTGARGKLEEKTCVSFCCAMWSSFMLTLWVSFTSIVLESLINCLSIKDNYINLGLSLMI